MRDGRNWVSAFDASEGALYVTFLALLALHPDTPRVVAVDNVDQALNPRVARELIGRIQDLVIEDEGRPQMLLTSHNPQALDALRLGDDRVRLFVLDRSQDGATVVRRVAYDDALARARAEGMTLSRLWLTGALGGMPNL